MQKMCIRDRGYKDSPETVRAFRIIADHVRCATFILGDPRGVTPSNVDQGYILRRLIRRAIRYAMQLGMPEDSLKHVAEAVIAQYGEFYTELSANQDKIMTELSREEQRFQKTLKNGIREFERIKGSLDVYKRQPFRFSPRCTSFDQSLRSSGSKPEAPVTSSLLCEAISAFFRMI